MADRIVWEQRPVSGSQVAKKKEPLIIKPANTKDANAGILYLIEDALTATMTRRPDNGKMYVDRRMAAMMQSVVERR